MFSANLTHVDRETKDGAIKRDYYVAVNGEEKPFKIVRRGKSSTGSRSAAGKYINYHGEFVRVYANTDIYDQLGELPLKRTDDGWEHAKEYSTRAGNYGYWTYFDRPESGEQSPRLALSTVRKAAAIAAIEEEFAYVRYMADGDQIEVNSLLGVIEKQGFSRDEAVEAILAHGGLWQEAVFHPDSKKFMYRVYRRSVGPRNTDGRVPLPDEIEYSGGVIKDQWGVYVRIFNGACLYIAGRPWDMSEPLSDDNVIYRSKMYSRDRESVAALCDRLNDAELFASDARMFAVYQIRDDISDVRDWRFAPMSELETHGLSVDRANYELVYSAPLTSNAESLTDRTPVLNKLCKTFNSNPPNGYAARSVSVSDVIVLKWNGEVTAHYVDSVGFKQLHGFTGLESEPPEKAPAKPARKRSSMER